MKKITALFALLMLVCMGATAQVYVTETGQNMLSVEQMKAGVDAGDFYVSMQQHQTSTHNYINSQGKLQGSYNTDGTTAWKVEKKGSYYVLKSAATGKYISSLGANNGTAAGFSDSFDDALEFDPVQSESTDANIASGYTTDQSIWWNIASNPTNRLNTNGQNNIFQNNGPGIWTCIFTYEVTLEAAATPEQEAAFAKMDEWLSLMQSQALVIDPSFYTSNALQTNDGQGYAGLLDKNTTTFFHSQYNGTNPGTYHYLQANLSESVDGFYFYSYKRIQNNANRPTEILIQGSNDGENFDDITTVSGSQMVANDDYLSDKISASTGYQYIRFVVKATNTGAKFGDYVFFTYSEFWLLPSNTTTDAAISLMNSVSAANKLTDAQIAQINQIDEDLRNTMANVTYIVKDTDGNTLFTSEPQEVGKGQTITALPVQYQHPLFYTYSDVNVTVDGSMNIEFTATPKADAPFQFTADTSAPVWYNLLLHPNDKHYPTYVAEGTPNVTLPNTFTDDETTQWAFIGNPYGFQIVNKAAGDRVLGSAAAGNNDNNGGNTYATLGAAGSQIYETWTVSASTHATNGFFIANGQDYKLNYRSTANLAYWTGGFGAGSTFVATKVLTDEEKYNELIALLESYPFGTNVNQYTLTIDEVDQTENALSLLQQLKTAGYSADNQAELEKFVAGLNINIPQAGFYRIKGLTSGKYLAGTKTDDGTKFAMTDDNSDATTIFCFDGTQLISYSTGMVNGMNGSVWAWVYGDGAVSTVTFQDGLSKGGYGILSSNANFYDNGTSADRGKDVTITTETDIKYRNWYLEPVTQLPVTLHESETKEGYSVWIATFSAPVSVVSVEGAEIHKVSDTGSAFFCEPANVQGIPAGKGALLVTNTETATATVTLGETSEDFETILQPLYACEKGKAGLFFGKVEGSQIAGLYPIDSETPTGGFKAFVDDSTGEGKELVFDQDPTGIENMEHGTLNMNNGAIYNLQGQKVNKAQKGVFIQNGKKVVLK